MGVNKGKDENQQTEKGSVISNKKVSFRSCLVRREACSMRVSGVSCGCAAMCLCRVLSSSSVSLFLFSSLSCCVCSSPAQSSARATSVCSSLSVTKRCCSATRRVRSCVAVLLRVLSRACAASVRCCVSAMLAFISDRRVLKRLFVRVSDAACSVSVRSFARSVRSSGCADVLGVCPVLRVKRCLARRSSFLCSEIERE